MLLVLFADLKELKDKVFQEEGGLSVDRGSVVKVGKYTNSVVRFVTWRDTGTVGARSRVLSSGDFSGRVGDRSLGPRYAALRRPWWCRCRS